MRVDIYSHHFAITKFRPKDHKFLGQFLGTLVEYEVNRDPRTGRVTKDAKKAYSFSNKERNRIQVHINKLDEFRDKCKIAGLRARYREHKYSVKDATKVGFKVKKIFDPRAYQGTIINEVLEKVEKKTSPTACVTLQPGGGKTLIAKWVMKHLGVRTMIAMRGGYIDRWVPELEETFKYKSKELLVIRGQKDLIRLMENQEDGDLVASTIMITTDTLASFAEEYANLPHVRKHYPFTPQEMMEKLGIGLFILDEAHQHPHKVMRIYSTYNIPFTLPLTATISTRDPFINTIYKILYPVQDRHDGGYTSNHMGASALMYRFEEFKGIRFSGFKGAYSHNNFEASLMTSRHRKRLAGYMGLVKYAIDLKYMQDYKPNTKCLVFFGTVKMCGHAVKYLKSKYPDKKIGRYTSKDPMTVLEECDIIVSTVLSAGTAVDIINLRTTIMTTAIDSQISNEQTLGRTRPVRDYPELTPEFCYFVCRDIPKHIQYHENKRVIFRDRAKFHVEVQMPYAA